jgi:hypothetical protein
MKTLFVAALLAAAVGCKSDRDSHSRMRPRSELTGQLPLHMQNCPSAVPSARTVATPTDHGVDLTIMSDDSAARSQILALARLQSIQRDPYAFAPAHTGMHGGPGTLGRCPIIHANTIVRYEATADGVIVHVIARDAAQVAALQRATDARVRTFATPSS